MKRLFLLVSALSLFGCSVNVTSTDDSIRRGPSPVDSGQMQLKTASGYQTTSLKAVTSVDIEIVYANGKQVQVNRHFEGAYAQAVLQQLQLNAPQEQGLPSAMRTGTIIVRADSTAMAPKKFLILNERVIQDSDFPEAQYRPSTAINPEWLMAQAPFSASYNVANCLYHVDNFGKWQLNYGMSFANLQLSQNDSGVAGSGLPSTQVGYCNLVGGTGRDTSLEVVLMTATANDNLTLLQPCRFSGDGVSISHSDRTLGVGEMAFVDFRVNGVLNRNLVYFGTKAEASSSSWANSACMRLMGGFSLN